MMRTLIFLLLRFSGLGHVLRLFRSAEEVTILCYHNPKPVVLDRHLHYLGKRYKFSALSDVLNAWNTKGTPLNKRPLIITLDDGHSGNFDLLPIFARHQIKPTIFLCSAIVGTGRGFWFQHLPKAETARIKQLSEVEREAYLAQAGFQFEQELSEPEALTAAEINDMRTVVDFQAHTRFHPILPTCDDAKARAEIQDCLPELEQRFNLQTDIFAYPNGSYCERDYALVKAAGYRAAVTVESGFNTAATDPFLLQRICIPDDCSVAELSVKASGLWLLLSKFRAVKKVGG